MLKTMSAALIATSLLAAPSMAATVLKTETAPAAKSEALKPSTANANAKMSAKKVKHQKAHKKSGAAVHKKNVSSAVPAKHIAAKKKV